MLGKLIKHEFTATGRILSILLAVLLFISPVTAIYLKFRTSSFTFENNLFLKLLEILCMAAFTVAMIAAGITTVIVLLNRFYQSMVTRESYLTHTLPVTTSQLVISKLIVAVIWQIISIIVMSISLWIFTGILGGWHDFMNGFRELTDVMSKIGFDTGNTILLVIAILVSIIVSYLKCYAAFALGHMINGHPFLGFIVAYIAISTITQIISAVVMTIGNFVFTHFITINIDELESLSGIMNLTLGASILFNLAWGVLFYLTTTLMFKKKLNI